MRATEIIRGLLDLIDQVEHSTQETPQIAVQISATEEPAVYSNEPNEMVQSMLAVTPSGTDMHHSKNPADIRTNAPSMFPGFQAGMR